MKFLLLRFSSIGDIVLTTPVIRCLKKQLNAEVHFLSKKAFEPVIQANPYIDKKYFFYEQPDEIFKKLKAEKYDAVIDLHNNLRSLRVKRFLGRPSFAFDKLNIRKWILVNLKKNLLPDVHIVDRYMDTVKSFGIVNDGMGLDYFIPAEAEIVKSLLPQSHKAGYIAWVIGARHYTKQLPFEKLISIGKKIKQPVIILGGKEDVGRGSMMVKTLGPQFFNACGKFPLNQSAVLVRDASKIITNDTGLMHIAAAFQKEIISIWGNTVPAFGMYPYYGNKVSKNTVLEVNDLPCRPCTKIGFPKCPKEHFRCMRDIDEGIFSLL
jgi:ADP-heptose:LPS heptosyltransferase